MRAKVVRTSDKDRDENPRLPHTCCRIPLKEAEGCSGAKQGCILAGQALGLVL